MKECPRGLFVPPNYREHAYFDHPIHVAELDFNISAPHIHASFLEELDVKPGDTVLDVGCGCGVVTAYLAMLVGPAGRVVAIDVRQPIMELTKANLATWRLENPAGGAKAGPIALELQNVFLPSDHIEGYDKVHVGAACPEAKVPDLLRLLKPQGGTIVAPIESEMRVIRRKPSGKVSSTKVTEVRFSELTVPCDAEIVLAQLDREHSRASRVQVPPSTYQADVEVIERSTPMPMGGTSGSSYEGPDMSRAWSDDVMAVAPSSSSQGSDSSERMLYDPKGKTPMAKSPPEQRYLLAGPWGPPDCTLVGHGGPRLPGGYALPAHKAVLRTRCEHFRARFASGMRDADEAELNVPDHFQPAHVRTFLDYVYRDACHVSLEDAAEVVHIAAYYGVPRLQVLCEQLLAEELVQQEPASGADLAPQLLRLADDVGLPGLKAAAVKYICRNFDAVSQGEAYSSLSRQQVDHITAAIARDFTFCRQCLVQLSGRATDEGGSSA